MQNIILLGIDISLNNLLPLLRNLCVCEILNLRNIYWLWEIWLGQPPCFSRNLFFLELKNHIDTKISFIHFESKPLYLKYHLLLDVKLILLVMAHPKNNNNKKKCVDSIGILSSVLGKINA